MWGRERGEEKWRLDRTGAPEGWLGEGRGSYAWRTLRGMEKQEAACLVFPLPSWTPGRLLDSQPEFSTLRGPSGPH